MNLSKQELLHEMNKELRFHQNGGTPYRQKTAKLAVEVVKQVADTTVFHNRMNALTTVNDLLVDSDNHRKSDVAKMVAVIVGDLQRKKTLPPGMEKYVEQKKQNRKPLGYVTK